MDARERLFGLIQTMDKRRLANFALVGFFVTVMGAILLRALISLGWDPEWANLVQAVWSVLANFELNNRLTWRDRWGNSPFVRRLGIFLVGKVGITIPLNFVLFLVMVDVLHFSPLLAYFINVGVFMVFNYIWNTMVVFRDPRKKKGKNGE